LYTQTDEPAQLYHYTDNTSGIPLSVGANVSATNLTNVNGASPSSACSTGISIKNFTSTTVFTTSLAAIEFTVTTDSGYQIQATSVSVDMRRNSSGPASIRLAYSKDGGLTWIDQGSNLAPNNGACGLTATGNWILLIFLLRSR
jgi:hypothetical protein